MNVSILSFLYIFKNLSNYIIGMTYEQALEIAQDFQKTRLIKKRRAENDVEFHSDEGENGLQDHEQDGNGGRRGRNQGRKKRG